MVPLQTQKEPLRKSNALILKHPKKEKRFYEAQNLFSEPRTLHNNDARPTVASRKKRNVLTQRYVMHTRVVRTYGQRYCCIDATTHPNGQRVLLRTQKAATKKRCSRNYVKPL